MASELILSLKKRKNSYGSKISILSPAKINLYLNIIGKYPSGFHRIESIAERVSLFDRIDIEVTKPPHINISSNIKSLETDENLCFKAANLAQKKLKIPFGFNIFLNKNIPIGAGLGGGSSNAASVLLGLNKLLDLKLEKEKLYHLGASLGSDVNFFLNQSSFAFLEAKGQKAASLNIERSFKHLIVWPNIPVSTKKVYNNFKAKLTKNFNNVKILKYALAKGDVSLVKRNVFNILEKETCSVYPKVKKAKERFERYGVFLKMSGSGSAFYTICKNTSIRKIRSIVPDRWAVFKVQTF
ncbi:MAG: 4-(cytidine 5'-diphospho)-2-C-methyl-D-erythritol kinase [Candidatus Omnitrophota bacterium]